MALKTYPFDTAQFMTDPADQVELMQDALKSGKPEVVASALGIIGRARGMARLAKDSGVTRMALYKSFSSKGDPRLSTLLKVTSALGFELTARPVRKPRPAPKRKAAAPVALIATKSDQRGKEA